MAEEVALAILDIVHPGRAAEPAVKIGEVELYRGDRIGLLHVVPEFWLRLSQALDAVNRKPRIVELVPAATDQPFVVTCRVFERGAAGFVPALSRFMRRYYGFELG